MRLPLTQTSRRGPSMLNAEVTLMTAATPMTKTSAAATRPAASPPNSWKAERLTMVQT